MATKPVVTMASSPATVRQERGRPVVSPQRGAPSYQSMRWPPPRDFSPHANIRSRDFSPHMSPDRVTRNISPGRQKLREQNMEVVSRVPQMYRTSFSAVTSPKRLPRRMSPNRSNMASQSSFMASQTSFIATPLRATMPGRITSVDRSNKESCDTVNKSAADAIANKQPTARTTSNRSASTESPSAGRNMIQVRPGAKYEPDVRRLQSDDSVFTDAATSPQPLVNGDSPTVAPPASVSSPAAAAAASNAPTATTSYCYVVQNEFSTSEPDTAADQESSSSPRGRIGVGRVECAEVRTKRMIEKEYVHVHDVSYFEALKKKNDSLSRFIDDGSPPGDVGHRDKKRTRSPFRWSKNKNNSSAVNTNNNGGGSEPNSPARGGSKLNSDDLLPPGGGRAVRSTTLPSEILTGGGVGSPNSVKKSSKKKSKSITSFFQDFKRRLSPKTLRKQLSRADPYKDANETHDSTGSLCASQDNDSYERLYEDSGADEPGTPTKGHQSKAMKASQPIRSWLTGGSDSKKGKSVPVYTSTAQTPNGDTIKVEERNGAIHPMPNDSNATRILKSIEDNHNGDKSVYQAFKEKHSPKLKDLSKEAAGMKPQAFKVVEFPEKMLSEGQGPIEVNKSLSEGHASRQVTSSSRQQPHATGSEPSLGSRNENHVTGSDSASKRTLVSQENMSPSNRPVTATTTPTATDATHNATTATEATTILPTTNDLELQGSEVTTLNFDNSPAKTPSYLNASRLASGYTPYSSYTPVLQARNIKVLRKSEESESDSSLSSTSAPRTDESRVTLQGQGHGEGQSDNQVQQQPITNGHLQENDQVHVQGDLDLVDSARISSSSGSNVKVTSRTQDSHQPQRPLSGGLAGVMSRSSQGEECSGLLENGVGGEEDLKLNLPREENVNQVTSPDTPAKGRLPIDGHYFLDVMRREEKKIQELCSLAENDLQTNHGEEVNGKLRATIGKATLLTSKKFNQFKGLCQKSNERDDSDPFPIMPKDLVGFWDLISIQVEDVYTMFSEIERMRLSGWTQVQTPTTTAKSVGKGAARKSPRSKSSTGSQKAQEAAKARDRAREEARKRLLAAKKAGRMRKRSNSDKDEIEIFVPE